MLSKPAGQMAVRMRILALSHQLTLRYRLAAQIAPRAQTRFSSSTQQPSSSDARPQGSLNHKTFYKTFGRPIAKVFLMAIFTYQLAYYLWVRLEQDEKRAEMQAIISDLEARIQSLENANARE